MTARAQVPRRYLDGIERIAGKLRGGWDGAPLDLAQTLYALSNLALDAGRYAYGIWQSEQARRWNGPTPEPQNC